MQLNIEINVDIEVEIHRPYELHVKYWNSPQHTEILVEIWGETRLDIQRGFRETDFDLNFKIYFGLLCSGFRYLSWISYG